MHSSGVLLHWQTYVAVVLCDFYPTVIIFELFVTRARLLLCLSLFGVAGSRLFCLFCLYLLCDLGVVIECRRFAWSSIRHDRDVGPPTGQVMRSIGRYAGLGSRAKSTISVKEGEIKSPETYEKENAELR